MGSALQIPSLRTKHWDRGFALPGVESIGVGMDAAALNEPKPTASQLLLQHCQALDTHGPRPTAAARLEALLGPELAQRLVLALSAAR